MSPSITLSGRRLALVSAIAGILIAFPLVAIAQSFTDVPTNNSYYADIEALKAKGVTTGCAPNLYCPKDYVTREQMAAFMNRLGALSGGKAPVVNADKVDGYDSSWLARAATSGLADPTAVTTAGVHVLSLQITAPLDGYLVVHASTSMHQASCTSSCDVLSRIWNMTSNDRSLFNFVTINGKYANLSNSTMFAVSAGPQVIDLVLLRQGDGTGTLWADWTEMTAVFVPFGPTGIAPSVAGPVEVAPAAGD